MTEEHRLYEVNTGLGEVPTGLPLVVGLTGFTDAGSAAAQFTSHLIDNLDSDILIDFDNDELLDYRARRPTIFFNADHLEDYTPNELSVRLAYDDLNSPFLLLSGYEPDFRWNGFTRAVIDLIDRYQVRSTTMVHSIPMPVPHTRPIRFTASGNREELISSNSAWKPSTTVPANVASLLEYRLAGVGRSVANFAALVPHYLAETEYPASALALQDMVTQATGLVFPSEALREENRDYLGKIEAQVSDNSELERLVGTLEERYDAYMEGSPLRSPLTDEDGELPSADEIAAELENFLAFRKPGDDSVPGTGA